VARLGIGDADGAATELASAARVGLLTKDMPVLAEVAISAAVLAGHAGDDRRAAVLLGASEAIRGRADRSHLDARALEDVLRARVGADAFGRLLAEGAAMTQEAAVELATTATPSGVRPTALG